MQTRQSATAATVAAREDKSVGSTIAAGRVEPKPARSPTSVAGNSSRHEALTASSTHMPFTATPGCGLRSFISRMDNLGCPDIIFVFGGTNDSWAGEPVGDYKYEKWNKGDFYTFRPAMAYMLDHMLKRYPNTRLYIIINSELRDDITESMKTICQHYGVKYIQLKDIDKMNGHPSIKGMAQIAQQISAQL